MTTYFIQVELFAILIAVGISICIWCIWKFIYALAQEDEAEKE